MKKRTKGLLLITVFFALGFLLVHFFFTNSDALLLDNEFLITFVGVVLGISATIVTFIFSSTEKIQKVISNLSHEKNRTDKINKIFKTAYAELIEDSSFIFIIFILLIICVLFSAIDIPYISFPAFMLLGSGEINHSGSGENRQFWSNENHQSGVASPQVVLFTRPAAGQPVSQ